MQQWGEGVRRQWTVKSLACTHAVEGPITDMKKTASKYHTWQMLGMRLLCIRRPRMRHVLNLAINIVSAQHSQQLQWKSRACI